MRTYQLRSVLHHSEFGAAHDIHDCVVNEDILAFEVSPPKFPGCSVIGSLVPSRILKTRLVQTSDRKL